MNEMPRDADAVRRPGTLSTPLPSPSPSPVQLQPLMDRLACLQAELDETRRQLAVAQRLNRRPEHRIIDFVGSSPAAQEVKRQARRVAQADATVLLLGEAGTGKSLLAQAIHAASRRAGRPLVTVDITAVPEALLDEDLFGVAPDSGPDVNDAPGQADPQVGDGQCRLADGGTLVLEEIGRLPLALQAKLLRVLQAQEVEPPGGGEPCKVDVRVIATTSRDLAAMVQRGEFRADLYYGLHVLPIRVPALRDRVEDIEALVEVLLEELSRRGGLPPKSLGASALAALQRRPWVGNVSELRDVLEQAFLAGSSPVLTAADLGNQPAVPLPTQWPGQGLPTFAATLPVFAPQGRATSPGETLRQPEANEVAQTASVEDQLPLPTLSVRKAQLEREAIANALRRTNGNRVAAARLLAISRATLYEKLARWPELGRRPGSTE